VTTWLGVRSLHQPVDESDSKHDDLPTQMANSSAKQSQSPTESSSTELSVACDHMILSVRVSDVMDTKLDDFHLRNVDTLVLQFSGLVLTRSNIKTIFNKSKKEPPMVIEHISLTSSL
jgi:hypothetical protein